MTSEESKDEMLLETAQILEGSNLLEFLSSNHYAWYLARKLEYEQDFNPVEKRILDAADKLKK